MLEEYIAVDLEMTGLRAKTDRILEIGAVQVRNGEVCAEFSRMVNPMCAISPQVQELTGITQEMAEEGIPVDQAAGEFLEFAKDLVWVGHNIIYDYSFLKQWAVNQKIPLQKQAVDTLKIARKCLPELEKKSLDYLCEYYGIIRAKRHRACDDARATAQLYQILEEKFADSQEVLFRPRTLEYRAKRQTPATPAQKNYLKELAEYHKIDLDMQLEQLSRSEASRTIDGIIRQYGRMEVSRERGSGMVRP